MGLEAQQAGEYLQSSHAVASNSTARKSCKSIIYKQRSKSSESVFKLQGRNGTNQEDRVAHRPLTRPPENPPGSNGLAGGPEGPPGGPAGGLI